MKTVLALSGLLPGKAISGRRQMPRRRLNRFRLLSSGGGEYEVTALFDGYNDFASLVTRASGDKVREPLLNTKFGMPNACLPPLTPSDEYGKHRSAIDSG